jgi:Pro-kumamolisin, activation domain/Bacterial Ig-like domain (group 3)
MRQPASFLLSCLIVCVFVVCFVAFTISIPCASAQDSPMPARIVSAIDPAQMVTLQGNVHPLARAAFDQGPLADAQPLHRMLLLLQRGPDQEKALRQLLDDQQSVSSSNFHQWLTPQQFGAQFGPAPADVQTVTTWLQSQGFKINRVSAGMTVIEFDGTAGQVRNAFHTQMHRYVVNGQERKANASDPQIPAALAPVVAGVVSLHNFPVQSHLMKIGAFKHGAKTGTPLPLYTPSGSTDNFPLVPADFATIYNVTPLWNAGVDGTGQSIAVVGQSQIDLFDIQNFRTLFGLSNNFTSANIIVDGIDPGFVDGDETESDLDVEWSGAVAKNATIKFVIAASTEVTGGTHLSALYIVDHNVAPVLSESYGVCEKSLGTINNQYYNALWEQAAAQGITVILSAGDGGSAGCDDFNAQAPATQGLAVSGYASTPFNVAVGGTDFDQINKWQQFWSPTNDPVTFGSALGYIPEIPWNDSCAQLGLTGCGSSQVGGDLRNIVAGSGGPSSLYSKPSWQSGAGVPQDNKRDIPDVSLFASNGFTGSGYLICASDQGGFCQSGVQSFSYLAIGGTSASAPAFAGIMALVNHSQAKQSLSSRQGNANYILYALAKKQANITPALNCNASASPVSSCTFNDVTRGNSFFPSSLTGTNSVACQGATANCSATVASQTGALVAPGTTTPKMLAWTTNPSYDLAVGLGSVNAQNLVTNWKSANATATTTTLSLNGNAAVNITHGAPVSVTIGVTPTAAIGDVALVGTMANNDTVGLARFTLANGAASGTTSNLAGGTYKVTAHYEGDGTNAPSDSAAVNVTVAPENSNTFLRVPSFDPTTGRETSSAATTLVYGSFYLLRADVTNSTGSLALLCSSATIPACPSGSVTVTDSLNGAPAAPVDGGTFVLNSAGYTEDQAIFLGGGAHTLTAQYGGDSSFVKSTSAPYLLTITPAPTTSFFSGLQNPVIGQQFVLNSQIQSAVNGGAVPTGTVTFFDGTTPLPGTVILNLLASNPPSLGVELVTTVTTAGTHTFSTKYGGDASYSPSTSNSISVFAVYPTNTTISLNKQNIIFGDSITATATVTTSVKTPALGGKVLFFVLGAIPADPVTQTVTTDANGNTQIVATITTTPQASGFIAAQYSNDPNFVDSSSPGIQVQVTTPDFSISNPPTVLITAGQTGTTTLTITPLSKLSSTVTLTCGGNLPAGSTCSLNPPSVMLANGVPATTVLSITSLGPSGGAAAIASAAQRRSWLGFFSGAGPNVWRGLALAIGLAAFMLSVFGSHRQTSRWSLGSACIVALICVVSVVPGCGGGGGSTGGGGAVAPPPPPPPPQKVSTTMALTSSSAKIAQGTSPTMTATVTSTKPVSGSVTFSGNFFNTGPIPLVNGVAQTPVNGLPLGTVEIDANYSGDTNNLASMASFNQTTTGNTLLFVAAQTGQNFHQITVNATLQ